MTNAPHSQRGLGLWSGFFMFGFIAIVATLVIKCGPIYLNEASIQAAVADVASKNTTSGGQVDVAAVRKSLQARWDIDYISQIEPKDVKLMRSTNGQLLLGYDYEARVPLFYNMSLILHFAKSFPLRGAAD